MLFVGGLDLTIVGHYSFGETAYYSVAASPTTLVLMIIAALTGPLLPATSALSVQRNCTQMGSVLVRSTRYATILLALTGLPFLVIGYPILRVWVGPVYAEHSVRILRILIVANIIRNLCAPYATMVVAMSRQGVATASAITEGVVNLVSSIWLVQHIGALGVALGTLLGAIAGVAMHFGVSMRYTESSIFVSRKELLIKGILHPMVIVIPSLVLVGRWLPTLPSMTLQLYALCAGTTVLLAWFVSMTRDDRKYVVQLLREKTR